MTRRRAVAVVSFAVVALLATGAEAQTAKRFRIGVVNTALAPNAPMVEGLRAGLKQLGIEEGRDVSFDVRFTRGDVRAVSTAAQELAKAEVDLIFANGEVAARAAKAATLTIPIVFTLKALEPSVSRVLSVYHPDDAASLAAVKKAQAVAAEFKVTVLDRAVRGPEDVERVMKEVRPGDGLLPPDLASLAIPGRMLELSRAQKIPVVFPTALWIQQGALASYGSDHYQEGVQAAALVAKILKGAKPQEVPIEGARKLVFAINKETAGAMGITVPPELLRRADRVVE